MIMSPERIEVTFGKTPFVFPEIAPGEFLPVYDEVGELVGCDSPSGAFCPCDECAVKAECPLRQDD